MQFEFDPGESERNLHKHGIDFQAAQALWNDPSLLETPVKTDGEPRWLATGEIAGEQWSAIIAYRNETVRIVSVRRSEKSGEGRMKTPEFDAAFDKGEDITSALDTANAQRPKRKSKRVNIDCPLWMLEGVEDEADRLGVTRQSLIKMWLAERLEGSDETD